MLIVSFSALDPKRMSDKRSDKFANRPVANIGVRSDGSSDLISLVDAAVKTAKGRITGADPDSLPRVPWRKDIASEPRVRKAAIAPTMNLIGTCATNRVTGSKEPKNDG